MSSLDWGGRYSDDWCPFKKRHIWTQTRRARASWRQRGTLEPCVPTPENARHAASPGSWRRPGGMWLPRRECGLASPWSSDLRPLGAERRKSCCSSCPAYGPLLGSPGRQVVSSCGVFELRDRAIAPPSLPSSLLLLWPFCLVPFGAFLASCSQVRCWLPVTRRESE